MTQGIAIDQLLAPISEASPAGSDLRYTPFYEEIMEARRCEDAVALGDWHHDVKTSDWGKVIDLAVAALLTKTKDLQIAVWFTEALTVTEGFEGLDRGLRLMAEMTERFWDSVHPLQEHGDLEYRAAPFEFLNEKVALHVREVSLTDPGVTPGYSWLKWHESREVGSEADTRNRFGDVEEERKSRREERIAEGALTAEEFDAAVAKSGGVFVRGLLASVNNCQESLQVLESVVEQKFATSAPSLAELGAAVQACQVLVQRAYEPSCNQLDQSDKSDRSDRSDRSDLAAPAVLPLAQPAPVPQAVVHPELSLWGEALAMLEAGQLQEALGMLLHSSNSSDSARDRSRIRLLMAKLCLKADRADLARPIIEELHAMIDELQLERWESPLWIAEVLDAHYQCLQRGDLPDEDQSLSRALLRRICSLDVTKAMPYRI